MGWRPKDRDLFSLVAADQLDHGNAQTIVLGVCRKKAMARTEFRRLFERTYREFRGHVAGYEHPGVAVVAVDRTTKKLTGVAYAAARIGEPNALILGRHTHSDLPLPYDDTMSLRHVAVLVEPVAGFARDGRGVSYRVVDLRSSHGFTNEKGAEVGGIRANGPAFLAAGRYAFYFFITGDPTDWPQNAGDAWACVPERVYLDERPRIARGSVRCRFVDQGPYSVYEPTTTVQTIRIPCRMEAGRLMSKGEDCVAELIVEGDESLQRIAVGASALEDGILIGRSDRCDVGEALSSRLLSRVHLLIMEFDGTVYALDTASTNGTYAADDGWREFRIARLQERSALNLAEVAMVRWRERLALPAGRGSR